MYFVDISRFLEMYTAANAIGARNGTPANIKSTWKSCQKKKNEFIEALFLFKVRFSKTSEQF